MEKYYAAAGKAIFTAFLLTFVGAPVALLVAWPAMLALGCLHNDVSRHVPALGYWAMFLILWGSAAAVRYLWPTPVNASK